jgi:hypothetical protein
VARIRRTNPLQRIETLEAAVRAFRQPAREVVDFDNPEEVASCEARRLHMATVLIQRDARSLTSRAVTNPQGERLNTELPPDMREDSGCDL